MSLLFHKFAFSEHNIPWQNEVSAKTSIRVELSSGNHPHYASLAATFLVRPLNQMVCAAFFGFIAQSSFTTTLIFS